MKNRDMFIDLMEEIDKEHLEAHIKKNTDTRSKRIKRYITAAAIYAAACVAAFLLIPVVMNHTGIVSPNNAPGAEPVITEPMADEDDAIDEFFKNTKLYKVLGAAGVDRKDVASLQVDDYMIVDGDVYYCSDNKIYKNTADQPILSEELLPIDEFSAGNGYVFYTIIPNADVEPLMQHLYCYNMDTKERNSICLKTILYFGFVDEELVYVTEHSKNLTVYKYDPETEESELMHTIPSEWEDISSVCFTGDKLVAVLYDSAASVLGRPYIKEYDIQSKEWKGLWSISNEVKFAFADPGDGYYFSCEWTGFEGESAADEGVIKRHTDGVWYMNPDTYAKQKVCGTPYDELYFVNGKLVGVNGEEVAVVVENHSAEKHGNLEEGMVFPRPESMTISYGWKSYSFKEDDPLYEYLYEKINARANNDSLTEVTDREHPEEYVYRDEGVVRVQFGYYYDSKGAPFYPDKENRDIAFVPAELYFPITGDNNDVVFFSEHDSLGKFVKTKCFGTLADDPEIEAKIVDYFSNAVTE